ncbi:MAG: hypothetical protein WAQ32_03095 [Dethiobacteria bacterium]|jgi:polyhydroxyalkanoate synthesis regulator phasin|nr:hypothetical protein [Bacillota bacterium]NMD32401.1 hypothetical protein [Bacillota bacterium]HOB28980.1 hypothetical protein [Bacillota bacterium]HPZ41544.1 hypothetical protein [Bacillota bacterium]HQD52500.1 hypothetical protein [Bacillota bacterium]
MLEDFVSAFLGLIVLSKEKAEEFIDLLVEKGEMQRDEAQKLVNRMIDKGKEEKDRLAEQLQQVKSKLEDREKYVSQDELARVERKIDELAALLKEKLT